MSHLKKTRSPKGEPEVDFHHTYGAPSGKSCYNSAAGGPILTKLA